MNLLKKSVHSLKKAIKGLVVMSESLEKIYSVNKDIISLFMIVSKLL